MIYLMQVLKVILIGFRCYPTLVAVYMDTIFTLICGTLYAWLDFGVTIYYNSICRNAFYPTNDINVFSSNGRQQLEMYFKYYGTGWRILIFQLVIDIPRYICLAYISVKLPMLLFKRIRCRKTTNPTYTREQQTLLHASLPHSVETLYVRNLLGYSDAAVSKNCLANYSRWAYHWRFDFRFSTRVLSVYASVFLVLFFVITQVNELRDLVAAFSDLCSRLSFDLYRRLTSFVTRWKKSSTTG